MVKIKTRSEKETKFRPKTVEFIHNLRHACFQIPTEFLTVEDVPLVYWRGAATRYIPLRSIRKIEKMSGNFRVLPDFVRKEMDRLDAVYVDGEPGYIIRPEMLSGEPKRVRWTGKREAKFLTGYLLFLTDVPVGYLPHHCPFSDAVERIFDFELDTLVPPELLCAFMYTPKNRGYINRKRLSDALREWMPRIPGLANAVKKFYNGKTIEMADAILKSYALEEMGSKRKKFRNEDIANPFQFLDHDAKKYVTRVKRWARALGIETECKYKDRAFYPSVWQDLVGKPVTREEQD